MTSIRNLSTFPVSSGQQIPVFSTDDGVDGKISVSTLLAFFESAFASPEFTVQTAAPTATGFTQAIGSVSTNVWLQISATGSFASGTVTLPPAADAVDGQQVLISFAQSITGTLTITSAGATVIGAPANAPASSSVLFRYDTASLQWFCVSQGGDLVNTSLLQTLVNKSLTAPRFTTTTVAALPSAISSQGIRTFVTDSNAAMTAGIGAAVVGGGANVVPVYSDGGSWRIG